MLQASLVIAVLALVSLVLGLFVVTDSLVFVFAAIGLAALAVVVLVVALVARTAHQS